MKAKGVLTGFGSFLLGGAILLVVLAIVVVFIYGSAWASSRLLPWFSVLSLIVFGLEVFIFLPLAAKALKASIKSFKKSNSTAT